jgi:predicted ATPase
MEQIAKPNSMWPLSVEFPLIGEPSTNGVVRLYPGITTLVGPNGSGKSRALRAIKGSLSSHTLLQNSKNKIHLLAAGRSSPLEQYRAAVQSPGQADTSEAAVGHYSFREQWWNMESVTASFLSLESRADLRLKVSARLEQLLDRSVKLAWSQSGLTVRIIPTTGGSSYASNSEASGILHMVALLAAIHNDEIKVLLIDEPEISLHPQHQAFLLEEMESVAGDPSDPAKKLIVIATHSATMLPLRSIGDLPSIAMFNSSRTPPAQVPHDEGILKRAKLAALVARLSTTHRTALFAERVLLVEGPSDEIVTTQLSRRLKVRLLARNAHVLPVTGKGEFVETSTLLRLLGKQISVLADLDALSDSNSLVNSFSTLPGAATVAANIGRESVSDLDRDLRNALARFEVEYRDAVNLAAQSYPDWSSHESKHLALKRVTLARLLSDPRSFGGDAGEAAAMLCTRYEALLDALAGLGCHFLRRGAIENYFVNVETSGGKPALAAEEAATFENRSVDELSSTLLDVLKALRQTAPRYHVDEDRLLRPKLGAALTAAFVSANSGTSNDELNAIAHTTIGSDAEVFRLSNCTEKALRIRVEMASALFPRANFPIDLGIEENPINAVIRALPGVKAE